MRTCWCGAENTIPFSDEYVECAACGTLISVVGLSDDELKVENDEDAFYGKQYWLQHQSADLGFPNIFERARKDLLDRNLHWLKTLLKYKRPPSKTLELGCSHGSFVAMLAQAGFDASGMEMSPWVVEFAQETFDIPVVVGPIEALQLENGSYDVVALMDVLEHLPDPVGTMQRALDLLKPDGILLIQTPQFRTGMVYKDLVEADAPFMEQFKSDEHLYLFTKDSAAQLFKRLGADYITFEPAIFHQYDMFFVVSRQPITILDTEEGSDPLETPKGRFVRALVDQNQQIDALKTEIDVINADRAARLDQIVALTEAIEAVDADRKAQLDRIRALSSAIEEIDADRAARLEQIQQLFKTIEEIDADRDARLEQIHTLTGIINDMRGTPTN